MDSTSRPRPQSYAGPSASYPSRAGGQQVASVPDDSPPAIRTRSQSRQGMSSVSSSTGTGVGQGKPSLESHARQPSTSFARTSSTRAVSGVAKQRQPAVTGHRRVLSDANAGASVLGVVHEQRRRIAGSKRFGTKAAAGMQGIGVVRTGPRVVDPQQRSPVKLAAADDPFSLAFQPPDWTLPKPSTSTSTAHKRAFDPADSDDDEDNAARPGMPSPKRALVVRPLAAAAAEAAAAPAFDLTSPRKSSAPSLHRPKSSPRLHFHHDAADPDAQLLFPPTGMDVDRQPSSPFAGRSPAPVQRKKQARRDDESESEDDLDCLSPRKKLRPDDIPQPAPPSPIRSPLKARRVPQMLPPPTSMGATSVPMQRSGGYSSPPLAARAERLPSPSTSRRVPPRSPPRMSVDPQLLTAPAAPMPGPRAGLATKFGSVATPATFHSAFSLASGLPSSSTYYSNSLYASSAPPPAPTPATTWRSGIPRRAPSFAPTLKSLPAPIAADDSLSSSIGYADTTGGDLSMAEPAAPNSSLTSIGRAALPNPAGDENAKRLVNLQAMLSRLSMPRAKADEAARQVAASRPATTTAPALGARSMSAPTAPASRTTLATSTGPRKLLVGTGSYRTEYSVPLAPAHDPPSTSRVSHLPRRQSVSTTRPSASVPAAAPPSRRTSILSAPVGAEGELSARPMSHVLSGVIAFVDVRTGDGDDAGMIFVDMLKSMGARVTTRPTLTLTHIIYKSGRPGTLHRYRAHPDPKPFLVGISWVVRCAEVCERVDEKAYIVESGKEAVFQKKRRSMEPKALASLNGSVGINGATAPTDPALKATIAASIERVRRKSLAFAPKVGSPLAKRVWVMPTDSDEDE